MHKIYRYLFIVILISSFASCKKDTPANITTTDTTTIYAKWQWEYDIHDLSPGGTNYISSPSSTTQLVLTMDTNKTYSVVLNNAPITTGTIVDSTAYYSYENVINFQNSFNISGINFIMANNTQMMYRVNATRLFLYDESYSAVDSTLTHVFKIVP